MKRRLFTLATAVSLLLCLATVVLWVRSYWATESFQFEISHYTSDWDWKYLTFSYSCGQFCSTAGHHFSAHMSHPENALMTPEGRHFTFQSGSPISVRFWASGEAGTLIDWHGFYARLAKDNATDWYENALWIGMPTWFATAISALLPLAMAQQKFRRRIQKSHNFCPTCGYSLTGNTSGVCPECGTAVLGKTEA